MLILLIAQLVGSGRLVIAGSRKHLNADGQAREVFNRFGMDVAGMVIRADMDASLSASNDRIFFYSEAPGASSLSSSNRSTLALVGYRVGTNAQLERLGKGLSWAGTNSAVFLTYATNSIATNSTPLTASTLPGAWSQTVGSAPSFDATDDAYHLLADGVFRVAYCFQKKDGTYSLSLDSNARKGAFNNTSAIILTLAILDGQSRKIVADPTKLATALPDPTQQNLDNGILPAQLWQNTVKNADAFAAAAGIPKPAASTVRIYQRSFPINSP